MSDRLERMVSRNDVSPEVWDKIMKSFIACAESGNYDAHAKLMTEIIDRQIIEEIRAIKEKEE